MSISKIASAIPLVLGIACSTVGSQSEDHTGAMWPEKQGMMAADAGDTGGSTQPSKASQDPSGGTVAATSSAGSSSSEATAGEPSTGSSETGSTGSEASGTVVTTAGTPGSSETGSSSGSGGAMGSGGSSEPMGSGSPGGSAGDTGAPGGSAAQGTMDQGAKTVQGKVSKISTSSVSITPKSGTAKTLKISGQTVVMIDGKEAKPSQLKQGQQVRASYSSQDGQDVATKIEMKHAKKKAQGGASGSTGSGSTTETH